MKKVVRTGSLWMSKAVITSVRDGVEIDFYFGDELMGGLHFSNDKVDELVEKIMKMKRADYEKNY